MARKKEAEVKTNQNIEQALDDIMSDRFGSYSKYIIQERALPDARDGLKPVQRRILYSMNLDGNTFDKPHRKSAKTVGSVMGTFHPHGDSSIYEAMVRLSQDWKVNVPLIDMHGNNGSIDDDPPAAMRYTEARLSQFSSYLLEDIDKNTVVMTNNYDDTELEPTVLPCRYPLLFVNGSTGIASGYATNIAPHNLNEVVNATIYRINHPDCNVDELLKIVKGPDFPTGGIVQGKENIKEVFETGKGKVVVRSKCEIVENKTNNQIIITEIPYEVIKSQLVKRITDLSLSKDVDGITDARDESGRSGLRIVIDLKKEVSASNILNYLYKNTDLQINYSYNNIAIVNHTPTLMSLPLALDSFISFRKEVVLNRSKFLKEKKEERLHIIEGLIKAISVLDDVIEIIKSSKDKKDAKDNLISAFLFSDAQAEAIVNLRLYRLTSTDVKVLRQEFATLTKEVSELNSIIKSEVVLKNLLIKELNEVNEQIVTPRKTVIEDEVEEISFSKEDMVINEEVYLSISYDGYLKRYSKRAFDANEGIIPACKEADKLIGVKKAMTLDTLLLFTSKGSYAYLPVYRIDECKFKDLGKHVSTYVKMEGLEKIVGAILVKDFNSYNFIYTLSKDGLIKKTSLPKWNVERSSKALTAMKLTDNDELVSVFLGKEDDNILTITIDGRYNLYSASMLQDISAKSKGVKGINANYGAACKVLTFNSEDNKDLLVVNEQGNMKRIHLNELEFTSRGAKGNLLFKKVKSNPSFVYESRLVRGVDGLFVKNRPNDELTPLPVSSVPFMSCDQSFSNVIKVNPSDFFILDQDQNDIQTNTIIKLPDNYGKNNDESEEEGSINLF